MANKLMIVDDEKSLLELLRGIFENEGLEVMTVSSGQECLNTLKKTTPDLIIMDMMMPGMSGRETAERIRKTPETKEIKIIFLTVAHFSETGIKSLKELGISDYITKPFENDDLVKRVNAVLKK